MGANRLLLWLTLGSTGLFGTTSGSAIDLTKESWRLSNCEAVYVYAAQLSQIMNNEGAAKNLLFRASLVSVALYFLNQENGALPKGSMEKFQEAKKGVKEYFDANQKSVWSETDKCDRETAVGVEKARAMDVKIDGRTFGQFQTLMFNTFRKHLGL